MLQAARILKDRSVPFQISFIGDGPLRDQLTAEAARLSLSDCVRFTGFLRGEELEEETRRIDAIAMPSVWEETAGLSAMEQMMQGRAVLAADIGGLSEVVGDSGLKFQPFNVSDLANKMMDLTDPDLRLRIGERGRDRAERMFRLERMIDEYSDAILAACGGPTKR